MPDPQGNNPHRKGDELMQLMSNPMIKAKMLRMSQSGVNPRSKRNPVIQRWREICALKAIKKEMDQKAKILL